VFIILIVSRFYKQNMSLGKVLSIQSHVVHGYVGNKAAVFPLQVSPCSNSKQQKIMNIVYF